MTEINQKIVNAISEGKTIKEISEITNLSYKQIYNRMRQIEEYGYIIKKRYFSDGRITYAFENKVTDNSSNVFELYNSKKTLKLMAISDLHIGNVKSDEEALYTIYNYCVKNGINTIIVCGDILDGTFSRAETILEAEKQIEHIVKIYPFDKSIINIYVNGDHDLSLFKDINILLDSVLKKRRHDICPISETPNFNSNILKINNNQILVSHKAPVYEKNDIKTFKFHLVGHNHVSRSIISVNDSKMLTPRIYVPPLCRLSNAGEILITRAIELTLHMNDTHELECLEKKDLLVLNSQTSIVGQTAINYSYKDYSDRSLCDKVYTKKR